MKTTLKKILSHNPCGQASFESGWGKAIKSFGVCELDTEVTPMDILKHAGIKDACWCLRVFDYKDYCLFLADVAESVVHLASDKSASLCIEGIRLYKKGKISLKELATITAAATATTTTAYDAANADYAATANATVNTAVYAAVYTTAYADDAANADYATAAYADADSYATAYATAADATARKEKWKEIEELYTKHFREVV